MKLTQKYPKAATLGGAVICWIAFVLLLVGSGQLASLFPGSWSRLFYGVLGTLSALSLVWLFLRDEKQAFRVSGLVWQSGTLSRFALGLLTGAVLFTLLLLPLLIFTPIHITRTTAGFSFELFIGYLALLPLALMEEVAFRSYTFLKLNQAFGFRLTQLITALAFALYHVANGWSLYYAFSGTFVWAFVYGLAAARSNGIALPAGIHVAVNALQKLAGMGGGASLYKTGFPEGTSRALTDRAGTVQLLSAVVMLLLTLLCTEFFMRRSSRKQTS